MREELVANAVYSAKMCRPRRIWFEFLAQSQNKVVNGARVRIVFVSPHAVEQLIAGKRSSFILNHILQYLEFQGGDRHRLPLAPNFHGRKIHRRVSENEFALGTCPLVLLRGIAQLPRQL